MDKLSKRILIVDDSQSVRESIRLTLEEQEFITVHITESNNVDEGLTRLNEGNFDIVILDLHMPGKTGFDFMDAMRQNKRYETTKVIMMTADDTLANIFTAEDKGIEAYSFLGKPFNILELQALVLKLSLPINR